MACLYAKRRVYSGDPRLCNGESMATLRLCVMFFAATCLAAPALADDPNQEARAALELQRLAGIWDQQRAEIKTAQIQADHFLYSTKENVGVAGIDQFFANLEKVLAAEDVLKADLKEATDTLPESDPPAVWRKMTLFVDNAKRRVAEDYIYPDGKQYSLDAVFDGTNTISVNSPDLGRRVMKGDTLGNITHLSTLLGHPNVPKSGAFMFEDLKFGHIRLQQGFWSVDVLRQSGFVREIKQLASQKRYYLPTKVDGIAVPRVAVIVRMTKGQLLFLEIYRIRSAQFNKELPDTAFLLTPRRGWQ